MFHVNLDIDTEARYDMAKFMEFLNDDSYDILNSYFIQKLKELEPIGSYQVTVEEAKPELISFNIFKTTQYWWVIMLYNDKLNPNDIVAGEALKHPSLGALEDLFFTLKSLSAQKEGL